eukprot:CAMPEP_0172298406 /NCGR_PEP_ID=MMETSP1058-20130122/1078_1 /TAXON_ID=83371 /ORGANISM="Detonula confervacea, Strain CCMP 353" /LENGTH=485 /DNA_ID=CAMNT_0013007681 /DNA_START=13 /DNA_END=1470 /DNA_ORIENTATION=+
MNLHAASSILGTALLGAIATAQDTTDTSAYEALGVDGSGTTNPSKCFRHIMAKLEEQIKLPTRFSYRAVGSGTGIKEFLGKGIKDENTENGVETDTFEAYNDFGAGDIPISKVDRQTWNDKGIDFVQLPFVLSAVSFFHNIPGVPSGERGLNMTACLLSKVFNGDINTWDHADILDINPGLNVRADFPIYVGRRVLGSSSTYSITHYLNAQCPQTDAQPDGWPDDKAASEIEWHPSTNECDGSSLMTACIRQNEGSIGYIDAAHGIEEGLTEIRLENGDGKFLTSADAGDAGVQAAAVDLSKVPDKADGDFSEVEFYNMPGPNTWPISLLSYVYIRKDLSHIKNPARRTLLKAFATALFDPDYISLCERYGHIPVPTELRKISLDGLEMVESEAPASDDWIFEESTMAGWGNGDRVISKKRGSFVLYEADRIADDIVPLAEDLRQLKLEMASLKAQGVLSSGATAKDVILGLGAMVGGAMMLGLY